MKLAHYMSSNLQVAVAIRDARDALRRAQQDAGRSPGAGANLGLACELAVRAVSVAWGDPRASRRKLAEFIRDYLDEYVTSAELLIIEEAWDRADILKAFPGFIEGVNKIVEHLIELANQGPPTGWIRPTHCAIRWEELSNAEQSFILTMSGIAKEYGGPDARVYLHGSRAQGIAADDSDYDILSVFPDALPSDCPGQAMGDMHCVAESLGEKVSQNWVYEGVWRDPGTADYSTLVMEVKKCSIEVPNLLS